VPIHDHHILLMFTRHHHTLLTKFLLDNSSTDLPNLPTH